MCIYIYIYHNIFWCFPNLYIYQSMQLPATPALHPLNMCVYIYIYTYIYIYIYIYIAAFDDDPEGAAPEDRGGANVQVLRPRCTRLHEMLSLSLLMLLVWPLLLLLLLLILLLLLSLSYYVYCHHHYYDHSVPCKQTWRDTGACAKHIIFVRAIALQSSSRNCSPAFDLVLWKLIFQRAFSGGVFWFADTGIIVCPLANRCAPSGMVTGFVLFKLRGTRRRNLYLHLSPEDGCTRKAAPAIQLTPADCWCTNWDGHIPEDVR